MRPLFHGLNLPHIKYNASSGRESNQIRVARKLTALNEPLQLLTIINLPRLQLQTTILVVAVYDSIMHPLMVNKLWLPLEIWPASNLLSAFAWHVCIHNQSHLSQAGEQEVLQCMKKWLSKIKLMEGVSSGCFGYSSVILCKKQFFSVTITRMGMVWIVIFPQRHSSSDC